MVYDNFFKGTRADEDGYNDRQDGVVLVTGS